MRCLALLALPVLGLAQLPAPEFRIDLDLPPNERQRDVARYFADDFPNAMNTWEWTLSMLMSREERNEWLANHNIPEEYQEEIRGFVEEVGHPKVTFERVLLWNLMYEVGYKTFCSGIVAMDTDGRVMHGRNIDFVFDYMSGRAHRKISDLAANFTYVKGGEAVFTTPSWAGSVGLHTLLKLNGHHPWSFQQNSHPGNDMRKNLEAQKSGAVPFGFYMRQLVEEDFDFRTAVVKIEGKRFSAPSYFLMAGSSPWEGASLEIKRNSSDIATNLASAQVLSPAIGRWYLIQTNDAAWETPRDDRRAAAVELMQLLKHSGFVNEESMMHIMRSKPLFNDHTTFSFVSVPATGYSQALTKKEYFAELNLFSDKRNLRSVSRVFPSDR